MWNQTYSIHLRKEFRSRETKEKSINREERASDFPDFQIGDSIAQNFLCEIREKKYLNLRYTADDTGKCR